MHRIIKSLILLPFLVLFFTTSVSALSLFTFTIPFPDLTVTSASQPLTYQFSVKNISTVPVTLTGATFSLIPPSFGSFAPSTFINILNTPGVTLNLGIGSAITGDFGTFTFNPGTPVGTTQHLLLTMSGFASVPSFPFPKLEFDTEFSSASASVSPVPEPGTILLLTSGLLGLAGIKRMKRKNSQT